MRLFSTLNRNTFMVNAVSLGAAVFVAFAVDCDACIWLIIAFRFLSRADLVISVTMRGISAVY